MRDLSLHILDLAQNSVRAEATLVEISVSADEKKWITISIRDDGKGMDETLKNSVLSPFATTRTTRKVGLGLPLMKMEAQMSGGDLTIESEVGVGTTVTTWFDPNNIDMPPLGDLVSSIITLIQGSPEIDFVFTHRRFGEEYTLDTGEIRLIMGDISLSEPEVLSWLSDFLNENESTMKGSV